MKNFLDGSHPERKVGRPRLPVDTKRSDKVGVLFNAEESRIMERYRRKHNISNKADCVRVASLREARRDLGMS